MSSMADLDLTIRDGLADYGYALTDECAIQAPGGTVTGTLVKVTTRGRVQVRMSSGGLLWSGPASRIGDFLEGFWFATRIA